MEIKVLFNTNTTSALSLSEGAYALTYTHVRIHTHLLVHSSLFRCLFKLAYYEFIYLLYFLKHLYTSPSLACL